MIRRLIKAALCAAVALSVPAAAGAATLSFDFTNGTTGMSATDQAGAPGVRAANYNNVPVTTMTAATTVSTVKDNSGATVVGASLTFTPNNGTGAVPGGASGANDANLYSNYYDQFGAPASTVQVSGIPYARYDVYFYRTGVETNAATRAGQFTIGSVSKYVRGGLANPDASGNGYVESTDTTFNGGTTTQGNYVRFTGLTGSTLTASFVGVNAGDSTLRNKVVGFQIVEVPEPGTVGALCVAAAGLLAARRRRRAT